MPVSSPAAVPWATRAGGAAALRTLYRKGKGLQWDAGTRIDWDQDLDPENPQGLPDHGVIMGILGFADVDAEAMRTDDERLALDFDRRARSA